jgi:hypothetical protein
MTLKMIRIVVNICVQDGVDASDIISELDNKIHELDKVVDVISDPTDEYPILHPMSLVTTTNIIPS